MKLRTVVVLVLGGGFLAGAGCKKKEQQVAPSVGSGSTMGSGSGSGMGSGSAPAPEAKLEGKRLAERYIDCTNLINGSKWDDFKSRCLAKDYKGHEMDGQEIPNADAVVEWFKGQMTAFPDMKIQPQLVLINGRTILAVGLISGTHTGVMKTPMGDLPATNKKIGQLMFHKLAINDENRATEEWAYFDPATMMFQLGLMPKDAPPLRAALDKGMDGAPMIVVAADDDKEKKNIAAAKKAEDAVLAHKIADVVASFTDDGFESDQAEGKDAKGKKEIQASFDGLLKTFPDFKGTEYVHAAAGDFVVLQGKYQGTNTGPLGKMPATKKKVSGHFAEFMEIKDGKIARLWRFRNGMVIAMQLGLMGEPGKGGPGKGSADMKGSAAKK